MASYGTIYQFSFDSVNGADIDIFILKKNYTGAMQQRALGRAPILKREKSGSIFGTSLEIYAECLVDGEFAQLYTSSADEYKVEVYKHRELIWTGFVSPELYSEPDIAPPYDVQIIATDGLGELKNYTFEATGEKSLKDHLLSLMAHTGLDLPYKRVTTLDYTDGDGAEFFWHLLVDLDYLEGKNCYDVLKMLLDSTHAQMTQQDAAWLIARECDYAHLASVNGVDGYEGDNAVVLPVASFGSMQSHKWWPVGQLSTTIHPAYKGMTIESERTYKASILQNSDMTYMGSWEAIAEGVTFLTDEGGYALKQAEAAIRQDVNIGILDRRLTLNVSAMLGDGGDGQDDKKLLIYIYALDGTSWVMMSPDGSYWGVGAGPVEMELNDGLSNIDVNIPVNASFSAIRVVLKSAGGWHKIVKSCHLRQSYMSKGDKVALKLANGARGEADDVSVELSNRGNRDYIYRYAVIRDSRLDTAVKVTTYDFPEGSFLDSLMARDYAKSIALPRMKITGVLNVPADGYMPVLFTRDNTFYTPQTYNYDLYNDEVSVELLSIPTAVISVESEVVTELDNASPGGSVSGGGSSGGSSGGGGGTSLTIDTEMSDTSRNAVENRVIKAYVDAKTGLIDEKVETNITRIARAYSMIYELQEKDAAIDEALKDKTSLDDVKAYTDSKFFSQAQFDPAKTHDYVKSYVNYDDEAPKTLELGVDLIIQDDIANAAEDDLDNGIFRNGLVTALGVRKYVQQKDSYTHVQGEASDVWMIEHNMGRYPSVTVVDSAGSAVFGDVTYTNENQLTVTFSVAFSGKAYLN